MNRAGVVGVLGGTFDPVHAGHLGLARAAQQALQLDRILLVPARVPPHRTPPAVSIYHRFAMIALAALTAEALVASDLELDAPGPSYTAALLERLGEAGRAPWQIVFITGADAFAEIATWYQYPAFLSLAHFAVVSRPGHPAPRMRDVFPALHPRFVDAPPEGRQAVTDAPHDVTRIFLIDAETPDVSATDVRRRIGASEPLDALVPSLVREYIRRHELYAASEGRCLA